MEAYRRFLSRHLGGHEKKCRVGKAAFRPDFRRILVTRPPLAPEMVPLCPVAMLKAGPGLVDRNQFSCAAVFADHQLGVGKFHDGRIK